MSALVILIPIALLLGLAGLAAFLWAMRGRGVPRSSTSRKTCRGTEANASIRRRPCLPVRMAVARLDPWEQ